MHYVDLIYYFTGAQPIRVSALGQKNLLVSHNLATYDSIQSTIEWFNSNTKRKFTSTISTNWIDPQSTSAMSDQKIKLIGTQGRIECDQKERGLKLISETDGIQDINPYFSDFRRNVQDTAYEFRGYGYRSIIQFIRDCHQLKNRLIHLADLNGLRATFKEASISTAVIESVNQSLANNGDWVQVST